jgi:hypothetical protein
MLHVRRHGHDVPFDELADGVHDELLVLSEISH